MQTKSKISLIIFLLVAGFGKLEAQDANTILQNVDEVVYGSKDIIGVQKIILTNKNGKEEIREATFKQKGTDMRIMRFTAPASQAGIAVLALPNDVMYMYLPAFGKERRISSSVKNQTFAGTDFSYEDMEPMPYMEKYTPSFLKSDDEVFVLELTPKGRSDYSKVIAHIDKEHYYLVSLEYYDRGNTKVKVANYVFVKVGKYWNSREIEMINLKKNHKTKMLMTEVSYDNGLSDDEFTVRKLKD